MEKMGIGMNSRQQERSAPHVRITAVQADSILTGKTRDTTRIDSTQTVPIDTSVTRPADTTRQQ